jgi:hypothetical protein
VIIDSPRFGEPVTIGTAIAVTAGAISIWKGIRGDRDADERRRQAEAAQAAANEKARQDAELERIRQEAAMRAAQAAANRQELSRRQAEAAGEMGTRTYLLIGGAVAVGALALVMLGRK